MKDKSLKKKIMNQIDNLRFDRNISLEELFGLGERLYKEISISYEELKGLDRDGKYCTKTAYFIVHEFFPKIDITRITLSSNPLDSLIRRDLANYRRMGEVYLERCKAQESLKKMKC